MATLFWNPWGVHLSKALLSEFFNADDFVRHILQPIHSLQIMAVAHKEKKKFILHMDNSAIRKAKVAKARLSQLPIHVAPHPPYSPDLAPSDFCPFGYLKEKILGREFESSEALLAWINAEFERIPRETLEEVYECWIVRLQKCIEYEGDYFPED
jgi:histone-lysine N-methyltransferase SETMAR